MDIQKIICKKLLPIIILVCFINLGAQAQKVVRYDLYLKDTLVNFGNKTKRAIAANGQIPMPTLTFTEGDTAEIYVHNLLKEGTSLHWHGLYVPNKDDGVPYLTQMPIAPGTTHLYRFPLIQNGTHWYHSHSGFQEQIGMYGSLTILKKNDAPDFRPGIDDVAEVPVILSEWTDYNPHNIHRLLHNATDWFAIRKGATQSYSEAIKSGHLKTKLKNEWKRMLAMDVSDIYYDRFLINGAQSSSLSNFKPGQKVKLRLSNAGASTYFWVQYAGAKMTVIANDGQDVDPVEVDRLLIAVSETYDVIVTIPQNNYGAELLVTSEDRTGNASLYLGAGPVQLQERLPGLKYFEGMKMMNDMMKMNGDLDDMGMKMSVQKMDMNTVMYPEISGPAKSDKKSGDKMKGHDMDNAEKEMDMSGHNHNMGGMNMDNDIVTLNYSMLRSPQPSTLPADAPVREFKFDLTGNMNRYVWSMDNKVLSETDKLLIKKGENVRIILYNNSMMRHPMHLHGHDFRLLNGQGTNAPLKNVLDIMPMETDTIEFNANLTGDWFFHCHILYHMMAGMNRVFSYDAQPANPLIPDKEWAYKKLQRESNPIHLMAENDFATNGNDGMAMLSNTRWSLNTEWRLGYHDDHGYEVETHLGRYVGKMQWLMPFIGFDWRYRKLGSNEVEKNLFGQKNSKDSRSQFSAGVAYTLPMLITFQTEVYLDGNVRLQLAREDIPVTPRMRASFMVNTDKEYMGGLKYILHKNIALNTHYDSDMGFGVGLMLNY